MFQVELIERKTAALTPSSIRCLSWMPTVNITAGCVHNCIYCYIKGYQNYPGDRTVRVYQNTASQVAQELKRKRRQGGKPIAVYFCPSSDAFQPIPEVLDQSFETMRTLLQNNVGVQFVTKGIIPDRFFELFAQHPHLVSGQIGISTLDQSIANLFEPAAAPLATRMEQFKRFIQLGITPPLISARADPLIHGITDTDNLLRPFLTALRQTGITHLSVSYLFLRPAIRSNIARNIPDISMRQTILNAYSGHESLILRGGDQLGQPLLIDIRRNNFDRIRRLADESDISLHICGCKNPDLTEQRCNLTQLTITGRDVAQGTLW
ncbi:MAG: hypothetical protein FWD53_04020 [Phycisphaerales bacterium]|nr:hypothetical protein [Phycisphaerales bacterium]